MAENLAALKKILTCHVMAGKMTSNDIAKKIKMGGGKLVLTDEKGGTSTVTIADVIQSNGVIHMVDMVLMPD
jgi:uncharacterized surface protein with fasciclin (FAS1) repeats